MRGQETGEAAARVGVRHLEVAGEHGAHVTLPAKLLGGGDAQLFLADSLEQRVRGSELEHLGPWLRGQDLLGEPLGRVLVQRALGVLDREHHETEPPHRPQVEPRRDQHAVTGTGGNDQRQEEGRHAAAACAHRHLAEGACVGRRYTVG